MHRNPLEPRATRPAAGPLVSRRRALGLAAAAGLAAGAAALLAGCGDGPSDDGARDVDPVAVWTSPYDWSRVLTDAQGYKYYLPDWQLSSRVGVDVSDHHGAVDWEAVAASGIEFAVPRAGYRGYGSGALVADEQFAANLAGARAAGLLVGTYFFSSAVTEDEAREEADFVVEALGGARLEYPIAYDQEKVSDEAGRANNLTATQYTANARAFCDRVVQAGYQAMFYGNQHQLALVDLNALAEYPVWYAEYDVAEPTGRVDFTIWQYTASATVPGISDGGADLSIHFL